MSDADWPGDRHVVLHCVGKEVVLVRKIIKDELVKDNTVGIAQDFTTIEGEKHWRIRMATKWLDLLMLAFPTAELSPAIQRKMRKAEEKRIEGMEVPDLPKLKKIMDPEALAELTDYQRVGIGKIYNREIPILADEMGLGKTRQAAAGMALGRWFPALVICPKNAMLEWERQLVRDFRNIRVAVMDAQQLDHGQRAALIRQVRMGDYDVLVTNIESLRAKPIHMDDDPHKPIIDWDFAHPELFRKGWRFCVVDEFHRFKTPRAQVTYGLFQLRAWRWLAMSGTPLLNAPEESWSILHKLFPDRFGSFDDFRESLVISKPSATEDRVVAYRPAQMAELRDFFNSISLRRRRDQVLSQLPPVFNIDRLVPLTDEQRELYEEIRDDFLLRLEDGTVKTIVHMLPQITRLKQACFSPELYGGSKHSGKIERLKEDVEELVKSGEKAIVFSQWKTATRIIERELLRYNPAYVDGTVKTKDRQIQQDKFMQDPKCKLYVGTIGANREAINLGVASYVIFTDVAWAPAGKDQAIGRSAAGGLRGLNVAEGTKVHVIEYQAEDTIEPALARFMAQKRAVIGRTVDRDGGAAIKKVTAADIKRLLKGG